MIRALQTIVGKNADASCVAGEAMKRGMGVQKVAGEAVFPAACRFGGAFVLCAWRQ